MPPNLLRSCVLHLSPPTRKLILFSICKPQIIVVAVLFEVPWLVECWAMTRCSAPSLLVGGYVLGLRWSWGKLEPCVYSPSQGSLRSGVVLCTHDNRSIRVPRVEVSLSFTCIPRHLPYRYLGHLCYACYLLFSRLTICPYSAPPNFWGNQPIHPQ